MFFLHITRALLFTKLCDGEKDCLDGSDESLYECFLVSTSSRKCLPYYHKINSKWKYKQMSAPNHKLNNKWNS
jgi:hypothetical protein